MKLGKLRLHLALFLLMTACSRSDDIVDFHQDSADAGTGDDVRKVVSGHNSSHGLKENPTSSSTIYSYVDERGEIHMVGSVTEVPKEFKDRVVVSDTARSRHESLSSDRVVVVDLRKWSEGKPLNYSVVDLSVASAVSRDTGLVRDPGQLGRRLVEKGVSGLGSYVGLSSENASGNVVILYSAPWCGFCRKAEAYLKSSKVPFVKKNIEADRGAALLLDAGPARRPGPAAHRGGDLAHLSGCTGANRAGAGGAPGAGRGAARPRPSLHRGAFRGTWSRRLGYWSFATSRRRCGTSSSR